MVFGNRWEKDILYREEMKSEKEFPNVKFLPFYQEKTRVGKVAQLRTCNLRRDLC